ncbi:MAG: Glyoxylase I family protein [uncultured Sulfurovum sp.]|uniref:Glyoxylase I family protein n=1 Tax=uncultured Sulfurovum sp. TaxID=269237 RepID=A0A6S6T351_9BACT|nr:MAG: Glyoxylase I family protein [uncultured Sulfurovum sp.]
MQESIKFYAFFGFNLSYHWESDNEELQIAHLKLGETFLELFCFKKHTQAPNSSKELMTDLPRLGIKHFGLKVKSIHATKQLIIDNGYSEDIEIIKGKTEVDYFFIKDPDGILLEFIQDDRGL